VLLVVGCCATGCRGIADVPPLPVLSPPAPNPAANSGFLAQAPGAALPNPISVPIRDREFFWNQLVDTVDDYFDIRTEQRVQLLGNIATLGRIETKPRPGATVLEPWHLDSTPGYEKWHATLQSLRRRAVIEVTPQGSNYLVNVVVEKALEDIDRPSHDTPGAFLPRHDNSLMRLRNEKDVRSDTLGWISLGRDFSLEQEILRELTARLFDNAPASY